MWQWDVLAEIRKTDRKLIEDWCKDCGVTTPVGYSVDYSNSVLTIYTDRPGWLIGYCGEKVSKFREAWKQEHYREYEVKFVEVHCGFVNVKEEK